MTIRRLSPLYRHFSGILSVLTSSLLFLFCHLSIIIIIFIQILLCVFFFFQILLHLFLLLFLLLLSRSYYIYIIRVLLVIFWYIAQYIADIRGTSAASIVFRFLLYHYSPSAILFLNFYYPHFQNFFKKLFHPKKNFFLLYKTFF